MEGSRNNRAVQVTEHIKKALFALIRIIIQQSITYSTLTFKLLQSNITTNPPSSRPITFSNINMTCCGRNNGECVCAKEATCSCGKQPALQCSMPLFLHPHPSCNYCFQPARAPSSSRDQLANMRRTDCAKAADENKMPANTCACGKRAEGMCWNLLDD